MTKWEEDLQKVKNYRMSGVIGFSVLCLALNVVLSRIASATGIYVYLDTVGTVLCAVFGGYLPGILVGLLTNMVNGIWASTQLYYGVLNVLIAVVSRFMYQKGWLRSILTIPMFVIVLTAIGGGIGGLLPMYLEGFATHGIFNDLLIDFVDKIITTAVCLVALRTFPEKLRDKIKFQTWYQNPISKEMVKEMKTIEPRVVSIRTKTMAMLVVAMLAIGAAATSISYILYKDATENDRVHWAEGMAEAAAELINGNKVDTFLEEGYSAIGYDETKKHLTALRKSSDELQYVYAYKIMEDGCHVVFDVDTEEAEGSEPGTVIPFDNAFRQYVPDLLAGNRIPPIISNETYGWLMTAYCPVFNDSGKCVCYAAVDISMTDLEKNARSFFIQMIFLFLGFFILALTVGFWVTEYNIVLPINAMALCTNIFANHSDADIQKGIERMEDLGIVTGDEVENFYHSICKMTHDTASYIEEIEKKSETIQKLQNALVLVLADMVESRDKNTGAHVRKTAAYAKEIMLSLRRMGYHTDILTDEYIADVEHSAPLHDIGKIAVPDAVLNKPGKLDDGEFEVMKSHTTEGEEIINRVIRQVPNSDFLEDARDLAKYHHEKWDGRGYPTGISGEDIPLAARVMAVADVFDALTSKRSYKPPFSYEKAMEIIEEGSGTHFDPTVVEAFKASEQRVREIQDAFDIYNR